MRRWCHASTATRHRQGRDGPGCVPSPSATVLVPVRRCRLRSRVSPRPDVASSPAGPGSDEAAIAQTPRVSLAWRDREHPPWCGPTPRPAAWIGFGGWRCARVAGAVVVHGEHSRDLLLVFGPCPHVLYVEDGRHPLPKTVATMSKFGPDPLVLYVEPVAIKKERPMHRHMPRCQRPAPTRRRCRHHGLAGRSRLRDRASAGPPSGPGTSRIGLPSSREARVHEGAGQGTSPAFVRDPDWRGRLRLTRSRLIGGRR